MSKHWHCAIYQDSVKNIDILLAVNGGSTRKFGDLTGEQWSCPVWIILILSEMCDLLPQFTAMLRGIKCFFFLSTRTPWCTVFGHPQIYGGFFVDCLPLATPVWLARPEPLQTVFRTWIKRAISTPALHHSNRAIGWRWPHCFQSKIWSFVKCGLLRALFCENFGSIIPMVLIRNTQLIQSSSCLAEHPMVITVLMSHIFRMMDRPSCDGIISAMSSDQWKLKSRHASWHGQC